MAVGVLPIQREAKQLSLKPNTNIRFRQTASQGGKGIRRLYHADNIDVLNALAEDADVCGKVTLIYIDPPYNTGARDWKYNNDYVDNNDQYRHSKWLSMMQKRLRIAKKLLNPPVP